MVRYLNRPLSQGPFARPSPSPLPEEKPKVPAQGEFAKRSPSAGSSGGGASGKMLYKPKITSTRLRTLQAMLGIPFPQRSF